MMRKITNNAKLGKVSMLLNILILISFIFSMVMLMKFDKVNVKLVANEPIYTKGVEKMQEVEKPRRQAAAEYDFHKNRLDSLTKFALTADKNSLKNIQGEIERYTTSVKEKKAALHSIDSLIAIEQMMFEPFQKVNQDYEAQVNETKGNFHVAIYITIFIFLLKILAFGYYNVINLKNLRVSSPWMSKSTSPYWGLLAWFIPAYNFIKPYTVFAEVWNETDYILKDKGIVPNDTKDDNNDFYLGLWWGFFLLTFLVMTIIINSTFFGTEAMYNKLSHSGVIIITVILWILFFIQDTIIIRKFNKMNQLLFANQSKL
ncbi:MAG TPA: DUF4328 domain-containing protein [Bacteroidales bacterium]|jgi:hypothetical protein|nr:DUF4328 domain-containing protein [Bacteroidales bacterium]HPS70732.1 DUF4328 domain-containing protein [Bacteroidales bacterium]